uniref:Uncharacterized protein n=1 Tax=Branchiostoma floridae TaxID=7739 RepID=C3ZJN3_BRAFL|eukprot:XP_002591364.1 hypothetical protein BRAFLDRAFT_76833 [Branchiostoma floridae]
MKTVRLRELLLLLLSAALLVVVTECLPRQSDPYYPDDSNDMALEELRDLLEERELELLRAEAALPERARRYKTALEELRDLLEERELELLRAEAALPELPDCQNALQTDVWEPPHQEVRLPAWLLLRHDNIWEHAVSEALKKSYKIEEVSFPMVSTVIDITVSVFIHVMSSVLAEEEEEENFLPVDERSAEEEEATLEELLADILARLRGNEEEKRGLGKFGRRPLRQGALAFDEGYGPEVLKTTSGTGQLLATAFTSGCVLMVE